MYLSDSESTSGPIRFILTLSSALKFTTFPHAVNLFHALVVDEYGCISDWLWCFGGRFIMLISCCRAGFSSLLCDTLFHLSPSLFTVSTSWHTEEDSYRAPPIDRSILPTAPRSAREPKIDRSRLPRSPPYTAFLGNLPYDVTEDSIKDFFRGLAVGLTSKHTRSTGHSGYRTWVQPLQLVVLQSKAHWKTKNFGFVFSLQVSLY